MQKDEHLIPAVHSVSQEKRKSNFWQMWLIVIVFATPVIASYVTFYWIKPTGGQTNYGQLISPVQSAPEDTLKPFVYGKWTLLIARPAKTCTSDEEHCVKVLFFLRQLRASLGKEMQRVQIVWINTDNTSVSPELLKAYDEEIAGVKVYPMPMEEASRNKLLDWLNLDQHQDAIHLLDPTGARMMIFTSDLQVLNFKKAQKDLNTLLKWNPTGKYGK